MICSHCGCEATSTGKARSVPQMRRYFAMIRAAFHHWPETCDVQFSTEEECRKYLQMKAGWRDIGARVPLVGVNKDRARMIAEAAIRGAGSYAMPIVHKNELIVFVPRSISFQKMGPQEFSALSDAVSQAVFDMTGIDANELLRQMESAA